VSAIRRRLSTAVDGSRRSSTLAHVSETLGVDIYRRLVDEESTLCRRTVDPVDDPAATLVRVAVPPWGRRNPKARVAS
jgi:hypothetical protein